MHNKVNMGTSWNAEQVILACGSDKTAFDQLVHHYYPILLAMTFLRTRNISEAEDLVQDILLRAWQNCLDYMILSYSCPG